MRSAVRWLALSSIALGGCQLVFPIDVPEVAGRPFSSPVGFAEIATYAEEDDPSLTRDLRELYFLRAADLWRSRRARAGDPWGAPQLVAELNTIETELRPCVSDDGLTLYFARGNVGERDIFVARRDDTGQPWGSATPVAGDVNRAGSEELGGWSSPDGLTLFYQSGPIGGLTDQFVATRPTTDAPFTSAPLDAVNLPASNDGGAWPSADGTMIAFHSDRDGQMAIWEAVAGEAGWTIVAHPELDSPASDGTPWLSVDGRIIVFSSNRNRTADGLGTHDDLFIAWR